MSVQHPTLGTKRRIFKTEAMMGSVYDWVGSVADDPPSFELLENSSPIGSSDPIFPDEHASKYANVTLST